MKNIDKLHTINLEIVKEVVRICEKYNLTYYMSGGTLLGAIRHKGFIPWDDDIDLAMPRDDYETFIQVCTKELPASYLLVNFKTDSKYQYYITRIKDINTKVIEERIGNNSKYTNASIDIFPLDGSPNNILLRKIYFFRVMSHRAIMSLCYKDSIDRQRRRNMIEKTFLFLMEIIPIEKIFDPYKQKCRIDKIMRKYKVEHSQNIGCLMGAYRTKQMVPKKFFGNGQYYKFEDIELNGPKMYDEYLKQMYGKYMELPPVPSRKTHFKIVEINGVKV